MAGVPALLGAFLSDMLSNFLVPGTSVAAAVAQGYMATYVKQRLKETHDIAVEEFRHACISQNAFHDKYEVGGVLYRYFNAVRDNTARLNLRLIARVMVGMAQRDRLFADEFTRYANVIASLSRDEIIAVTMLHKLQKAHPGQWGDNLWKLIEDEAVPHLFPSADHLQAALTGAMRSGLIISRDVFSAARNFSTSPIMDEIFELADFQDVLRREEIAVP